MDESIAKAFRKRARRLHENHVESLGRLPPPPRRFKRAAHYRHWCRVVGQATATPLLVDGPSESKLGTRWIYLEPHGSGFQLTAVLVRKKDPYPQFALTPVKITAHAMERVIQRLNTDDIAEAIAELRPALREALVQMGNKDLDDWVRTENGAGLLRRAEDDSVLLVTWVDLVKLREEQRRRLGHE